MFPDKIFLGMTLYDIFILVGVVAAFLLADRMTVKKGFSVTLQKTVIVAALAAVVLGYGSAVLFQAFYNIAEEGRFVINANTGATFYGGLIGGAAVFLLVYFLAGRRFCKDKKEPVRRFGTMLDIGACCVPLAHAFGRIGCLTAGCCHGKESDAWYAINMYDYTVLSTGEEVWHKVVPVQLFESLFLFALAAVVIFLFFKNTGRKKFPLMPVYCVAYGVWRFFIEYARADDRGTTFIPFLTPSQLVAVLLILVGVGYFLLWFFRLRKTANIDVAIAPTTEKSETEESGADRCESAASVVPFADVPRTEQENGKEREDKKQ